LAASAERYSKHPLAKAIIKKAEQKNLQFATVRSLSEEPGSGLIAVTAGGQVEITGRKNLTYARPDIAAQLPAPAPGMECVVLLNQEYAATFRFQDAPRPETLSFIKHLAPRHSVARVVLLSGDREQEVAQVAHQLGISEMLCGQTPEQKVAVVKESARKSPTLFVGDGINDAPAMRAASVSVAFGSGDDVVAEAADAVVLEPSLGKVDELVHIGRRMRRIALQSAGGGIALSMLGMGFAAAGLLPPVMGAVAQEVLDGAAVLNALRAAFPARELDEPGVERSS
jgi:P-type E1-E2 ATPase